jgi:ubiquinone/menaquinone biosynthesis C-methylase UbiE
MIKKFYYWLHDRVSKDEEKGEYSAGYLQGKAREAAFQLSLGCGKRCLEVGCGEGLFLKKLAGVTPETQFAGIDILLEQLIKADKRLDLAVNKNIGLFQANAAYLPFKDNVFDTIICVNVIMNIPSDGTVNEIFKEMTRICQKNGKIIFDIRNRSNLLIYIKYKLAKYYDATINCLRMYKIREIEEKLRSCGLRVNKRIDIGFPKGVFAPIVIIEAIKE